MGIFDGVLLCTDLDGTLANCKCINPSDSNAIKYFTENGGKFTLSTGRVLRYLDDIFDIVSPNTYVITLNGAVIVERETQEFLKKSFLALDYAIPLKLVLTYKKYIKEFFVYYEDSDISKTYSVDEYLSCDYSIDRTKRIHKIVFSFTDEKVAAYAVKAINSQQLGHFILTRSWPTGVEMLDINSTKGDAVKLLKKKLNPKLLVCAGDFENDIPMIKEADIGYAVGNAHPSLKAVADKITVSQAEGAISHIIRDIELLVKEK